MTTEIYNAAVEYRKAGFIVHPLAPPDDKKESPGKRPLVKAWEKIETVSDENLKKWFNNTKNNLGLQCGERSNVLVIDNDGSPFLKYLFPDGIPNTKQTCRTAGRGHIYFKYTSKLVAQKHHDLGIEILSDGSNAVLPPSVHASGDVYKWVNPDAPIMELPENVRERLERLFKLEAELKQTLAKCRKCFRTVIKNKPDFHGAEGREYMIAVCTDLVANGATDDHIKLFAKLAYTKDYNVTKTLEELKHIRDFLTHGKPWRCSEIKERLPSYVNLDECDMCEKRRENYKEAKEGKKKPGVNAPLELPPIPQEQIDPTPITIDELLNIFKTHLYVEEDNAITIPLSEVIANFAPIEPDIIGIVAPGGSSKTEVIRALGELENQYFYPLSSLTGHTFVSGLKENIDLAPCLRGRLLTIKDFTSILSKKKDEVSEIFADLRELTDGHIGKDYGSGVKKHYKDIHTSILFGCTNAIEKHNSMYASLGQRIVFFRPKSDRLKATRKAVENGGKENVFRDVLHKNTLRFVHTVLSNNTDRLKNLSQIPDDMKKEVEALVSFLAYVRTPIDRDFKGNIPSWRVNFSNRTILNKI